MREHPNYPGLKIYEGPKGDKPKAGAFYQPKKGDTLSWIGVKSGIPWRKINLHTWNIKNLPQYLSSASNCSSKRLTGSDRYSGFISLCPSVGSFQVIWVPPMNAMGPDEILGQASGLKPEDQKPQEYIEQPVKDTRQIKASLLNVGLRAQQKIPLIIVPEKKVPWWGIAFAVAVVGGMILLVPDGTK